ncbi:hypothetical protein LIER_19408 [Lithospermum erythrorhizon]|uniref:Uncharacterized protein n=1 Tax=Lithospermum erythrorhizon TaxID=34254 RepID=A0AAV3QLZ9_LITER
MEEEVKITVDELKEVNLGINDEPRPTYISAPLTPEEETNASPNGKRKHKKPLKQAQQRFRPKLVPSIEAEVNKLIEVGFIWEVQYPTWLANIVSVRKKNRQIRECVDFRDLNHACPKVDFPLPILELMIDSTTATRI